MRECKMKEMYKMTLAGVSNETRNEIAEKLNKELSAGRGIFINDFLFTAFRNDLRITASNDSFDFWCDCSIVASIYYDKVEKIEIMREKYNIKEMRWQ